MGNCCEFDSAARTNRMGNSGSGHVVGHKPASSGGGGGGNIEQDRRARAQLVEERLKHNHRGKTEEEKTRERYEAQREIENAIAIKAAGGSTLKGASQQPQAQTQSQLQPDKPKVVTRQASGGGVPDRRAGESAQSANERAKRAAAIVGRMKLGGTKAAKAANANDRWQTYKELSSATQHKIARDGGLEDLNKYEPKSYLDDGKTDDGGEEWRNTQVAAAAATTTSSGAPPPVQRSPSTEAQTEEELLFEKFVSVAIDNLMENAENSLATSGGTCNNAAGLLPSSYSLVTKVIDNVLNAPPGEGGLKFRKIKCTNAKVDEGIMKQEAVLNLLLAGGFEITKMPAASDGEQAQSQGGSVGEPNEEPYLVFRDEKSTFGLLLVSSFLKAIALE